MADLKVTASTARRILLARQGLLEAPACRSWRAELTGPGGTLEAVRRLGAVQLDPVAVVERCHHLTLHARVKGYKPSWFDGLFARGALFEYLANARCALPMEALPDFWPIMLQARQNAAGRLEALAESVTEVLETARREHHVRPRDVGNKGPRLMGVGYSAPDEASKASGTAIDLLWLGGQLFVSRRQGAEKWYALPKQAVPAAVRSALRAPGLGTGGPGLPGPTGPQSPGPGQPAGPHWPDDPDEPDEPDEPLLAPAPDAPVRPWSAPAVRRGLAPWTDMLMRRYLDAYTLADPGDFRFGWQKLTAAERRAWLEAAAERGEVVPVQVEGVRRRYWAPAEAADQLAAAEASPHAWEPDPEVRFLPPLDNLLWHRPRLTDLFSFDYVWEVYIPAAKRRYGAFTMPILEGDRLIGRIDPRLDRAGGRLVLGLVQLEPGVVPDRARLSRLARGLKAFARFHEAREIEVVRTDPEGLRLPL